MTQRFYRETTLDSGVTVLSESIGSVRSVSLGLWFAVGSRSETSEEAGMSHFLEHMMFKGTETRSAADISESFDRLGAELNAFTSKEYTCYFSRFLDDHLETAVEILGDMVSRSVLEPAAVASEKDVVLEEIHRHDDAPDELVHDVFAGVLWPDHPLSKPILGTRETVGGFDRSASLEYLAHHYRTGELVVVAAGNVDHDRLVHLLQTHLSLPESRSVEREEARVSGPLPLAVLTKDTEQAHIVWGVQGIKAGDESRYTLSVLDIILGGGMSSRLFQEIREKRGLAYAVYSYHGLHRETGALAVYVGTRPSNVEETLSLIRDQADSLVSHGVTEEELWRAKESIKGHLVLDLENTRNRMTRLGKNEITKSEILSIDEIVARVEAVQSVDVQELAARLFGADASLALVGPFETADMTHLID